MSRLTQRVLAQTRARVLQGDDHYPDKVLSVFETHTEAIRKGKKVKPTEFGKLLKVQEAENQFITDYQVCPQRVPDGTLWEASLERHQQLFGCPPLLGDGRSGLCLGRQRGPGRGKRRATRGAAAPRALVGSPSGASTATLVSAGGALAHRLRRTNQRPQAATRTRSLPLSRDAGNGTLGSAGCNRQQPAGAGPSRPAPRETNRRREEIKKQSRGVPYHGSHLRSDSGPICHSCTGK